MTIINLKHTIMKKIKLLLALFLLCVGGAQSVWAQKKHFVKVEEPVTIDNLTFVIYEIHECPEGSMVWYQNGSYAVLTGISGTEENVVVPSTINMFTSVLYVHGTISNSYVKTLTFESGIRFAGTLDSDPPYDRDDHLFVGHLDCPNLNTIIFNDKPNLNEFQYATSIPALQCPNLKDIYFKGSSVPDYSTIYGLPPTWDKICTAPASNITAHVAAWTQEQCDQKHLSANIWKELKAVVPYITTHTATLSSNGGGEIQLWRNSFTDGLLEYTLSSNGGQETMTLYDDFRKYELHIYYSGQKPKLIRNGTEVNTIVSDFGYCYYKESDPMGVDSYQVVYEGPRSLRLVNFGNGSVKLTGQVNGVQKSHIINGAIEASYSFDKTQPVSVEITPENDYKVRKIVHWGSIPVPFDENETTGVASTVYHFANDGTEESLKIYYQKKTIPDGTQFNVHMSVEGAQGSCRVNIGDGDNDWRDYGNTIPYDEMEPGDMFDVIGVYHSDEDQYVEFWTVYDFGEYQEEGIVNSVKVYANGELAQAEETNANDGDHYYIPLDGGDTDIRVVFESNGRQLSGNNGSGGTLAIYKEGSNDALSTYPSGRFVWLTLPKTGTYYAVVTPDMGKTVTAVLRDGKLLLSPNSFLQSDGTYRIPLEKFGEGETSYQLSIAYGDESYYTFDLAVVGDGSLTCIPFKEEDGNIQAIREVTASETEGRNQMVKAYRNEMGETGYVEFHLSVPQEGETVKVYLDGVDVTDKFALKDNLNNQYLLGFISSTPAEGQLCELSSASVLAIYEKDANDVTWKASMVGDTGTNEYVVIMVAGGDFEIDLYPATPTQTDAFDQSEIDTSFGLYVYAEPDKIVQLFFNGDDYTDLLEGEGEEDGLMVYKIEGDNYAQFFVDGDWVVNFTKKPADDMLTASLVPSNGWVLYFGDGNTISDYGDNSRIVKFRKGSDVVISPYNLIPGMYDVHLYVNGVDRFSELEDNENDEKELRLQNVTEDLVIEVKYELKSVDISTFSSKGGTTTISYTNTDGGVSNHTLEVDQLGMCYSMKPHSDVTFTFHPQDGYELGLVLYEYERIIGDDCDVQQQNDGSYKFVLPAEQFVKAYPSITVIYKKIGTEMNYDVNGDGDVTITDAVLIVDEILNQEP